MCVAGIPAITPRVGGDGALSACVRQASSTTQLPQMASATMRLRGSLWLLHSKYFSMTKPGSPAQFAPSSGFTTAPS